MSARQQRPLPLWVARVAVLHRFDCMFHNSVLAVPKLFLNSPTPKTEKYCRERVVSLSIKQALCVPPDVFVWPANIPKNDKIMNFDQIQLILRAFLGNCGLQKLFLLNCGPRNIFSLECGPLLNLSLRPLVYPLGYAYPWSMVTSLRNWSSWNPKLSLLWVYLMLYNLHSETLFIYFSNYLNGEVVFF